MLSGFCYTFMLATSYSVCNTLALARGKERVAKATGRDDNYDAAFGGRCYPYRA
jgi:hypothetical protein